MWTRTLLSHSEQLRAEHEGIRGHRKPGRPLGTWPETSSKVLWTLLPHAPPPRNPPSLPPPPSCCLGIQRMCKHWGLSSGGQGDSSHPGQGMMGQASTCPPPPQSLWWEQGLGGASLLPLQQLHSYPGVLEAAGAVTAHHGDLGLVRVKWLDLKPIFRRGGCSGGVAPSPVLQEGRAPVSAWLCGIFQTLQAGGAVKSVLDENPYALKCFHFTCSSCPAQPIFTPHLKNCVPICAAKLEQRVQWDADDRRQSHEEADGHSPAWVLVVVVGDWPVLNYREDENEL